MPRCFWCTDDPLYIAYHDEEWGVPLRDPQRLFELLLLEGFQAGLSWITVLKKRARYREVLWGFDAERLARMSDAEIEERLQDAGIIRNRLKLQAARQNARAWLKLEDPVALLWSFVDGVPKINHFAGRGEVPAVTPEAEAMSKALRNSLHLCRPDHLLCLHAGRRHGHGSHHRLRPLCRTAGRALTAPGRWLQWPPLPFCLESAVDDLKGRLVVGFLRLFALLPWRAVQAVGSAIGWLMWKLPNGSRQVVRVNLGKCFPDMPAQEREALVGQTLKDIGKTLTESACAWIWPAQKSLGLIRQVEGMEVLQQALQSGKGVVLISSHLGNWEMLLQYVCSLCQPSILYRPPKLEAGGRAAGAPAHATGQRAGPLYP